MQVKNVELNAPDASLSSLLFLFRKDFQSSKVIVTVDEKGCVVATLERNWEPLEKVFDFQHVILFPSSGGGGGFPLVWWCDAQAAGDALESTDVPTTKSLDDEGFQVPGFPTQNGVERKTNAVGG